MTTPQIYVACLSAYNNGHLHGTWIDAAQDAEDIQAEISAMLEESPMSDAEEWAIHDTSDFEGYSVDQNPKLEELSEVAKFIEKHGKIAASLYSRGLGTNDVPSFFEENYRGCYADLESYAIEWYESAEWFDKLPSEVQNAIDWEDIVKGWINGGEVFTVETAQDEIHFFTNA